jgi:ABC-type multidrug transport system ATPase subunit
VDPVVEFRGVSHAYGARRVLDRLDLLVARGESVALVGRAGKSTFLKLINRLLLPRRSSASSSEFNATCNRRRCWLPTTSPRRSPSARASASLTTVY